MKLLAAGLLLVAGVASAQAPPDSEARYRALIAELRCLVCQNQSIAESNATLAGDLREQVRAQIAAGRSDEEIIEFVTARYGDFVRYRPAFKGRTLLLWLGPFGVLLLAGTLAAFFIRRSHRVPAAPAPDPQRLSDLLNQEDGKPK